MRTTPLASCLALLLIISPGCGPSGSTNNTNPNSNSNGDAGLVEFPDATGGDSPIVTINQGGDISASVIGSTNEDGSPATITGLSGATGSGDFVAEVDAENRTERITIGETELNFEYGEGDTFNYSVSRSGETVFQGSDLSVVRSTSGQPGRAIQQVTVEQIVECTEVWIELMAFVAEVRFTGDELAFPEPEFIECLLGVEEVVQVSAMYCVSLLVFLEFITETWAECQLSADVFVCFERVEPSLEAISLFSELLIVILQDMIYQIRLDDQFCTPPPP